jgi:hypothetical protein
MASQSVLQNCHGFIAAVRGVQSNRVNIGVPRTIWFQLSRFAKLAECVIRSPEPAQCKAERMMRRRLARRSNNRSGKGSFAVAVPADLPVKVGQIDCRRGILRTQSQCSLVFSLCIGCQSASRKKIPERCAGFRSVGVGALRGDKLCCSLFEGSAIRRRLACGRNGREKGSRPDADAAYGSARSGDTQGQIWPAGMFSSMSRAPIRTIGSRSVSAVRAVATLAGETREASSSRALARATAGTFPPTAITARSAAASASLARAAWNAGP